MSAWLVSKPHIDALVTYALEHAISPKPGGTALGRVLWAENGLSLCHRYDDAADFWPELASVKDYVHEPAFVSYVAIVKAAHCYSYQSCEHPGWAKSTAKRICDVIEQHALSKLGLTYEQLSGQTGGGSSQTKEARAYSAAAWGLEEADVQRDRVAA